LWWMQEKVPIGQRPIKWGASEIYILEDLLSDTAE